MQIIRGYLRRIVFLPTLAGMTFAKRELPAGASAATKRLEPVPRAVICGIERGAGPPPRRGGRTGPASRRDGGR
jgi:enediyne biosynthesis protein E2